MGRFYKTASPQMVDFMYKVPEQAILKAIEGTDKQIDTENLYVTESQKLLQKKALAPDEARQKEKLDAYQKEINDVSQLLASSPLAALKDRQKIRDLGKKIYEDVTRGELSTQYKNYDIRQKYYEEELKRATNADGTIRIEDLNEAMRIFDEAFARGDVDEQGNIKRPGGTAYDPTTGTYRTYGTEKLVDFYDRQKQFADIAKDWNAKETDVTKEFIQGNYYVTTREKDKLLPAEELTFGIYKTMLYDPKAMNYYNQQIKLRGRNNKELQNKEFTRLFGERQDPGNINSPFKMVEVKDANGKVMTQKVQKYKYDKDGNVEKDVNGKPVIEEQTVPVMQMANPGELFLAAQTAAEKKKVNETLRSTTLDATEAYTTALQQQKEIAVNNAKEEAAAAREAQATVAVSTNNSQVTKSTITATTWKEAETNIANLKTDANKIFNNAKETIYKNAIEGNNNLTAEQKTKYLAELRALPDNNFKQLKQFLTDNKLAGVAGVLTGVEELENNYNSTMEEHDRQQQNYKIIETATKPKGYEELYNKVKELEKEHKYWEDSPRTAPGYIWSKQALDKAKKEYEEKGKEWGKAINEKLDINNKQTMNATTTTTYIMRGSELEKIAPKKIVTGFINTLNNVTKSGGQIFSLLGDGTNAVAVENGKSEAVNFNKLIKDLKISYEQLKALDRGEEITVEGKTVSLELGKAGVAPDELTVPLIENGKRVNRNLGKNAIAIGLKVYNPKTKQSVVNDIYIPQSEIFNASLKEGAETFGKYYAPTAFKNKVDADFSPLKDKEASDDAQKEKLKQQKEDYYQVTPEGHKYYPYYNKWEFAGQDKPVYGNDGVEYYKNLLGLN